MFKKIIEFFVGKKETENKVSEQAPYKLEKPSEPVVEITLPQAPVSAPEPVATAPKVAEVAEVKPVAKKRPGRKPNNNKSTSTKKPNPKTKFSKSKQ